MRDAVYIVHSPRDVARLFPIPDSPLASSWVQWGGGLKIRKGSEGLVMGGVGSSAGIRHNRFVVSGG